MKQWIFAVFAPVVAFAAAGAAADEVHSAEGVLRERFENEARTIVDSVDAVFGVVIKDLDTGDDFSVNADVAYTQASVIKLPLLVELFRQAGEGKVDLDEIVTVDESAVVGGAGILRRLTAGKVSMTVRDMAVLMIVESDNTATNMIIDLVGMENVNATMEEWGFPGTRMQRVMMDRQARLENRENISSPRETAQLLEKIHHGEVLDEEACTGILDILAIPKDGRIARELPGGVRVANKTGSVGGVVNDAGIVHLENRPFVVVAMASWNRDRDAAEDAITALSRLAYDYFDRLANSNRYGHRH